MSDLPAEAEMPNALPAPRAPASDTAAVLPGGDFLRGAAGLPVVRQLGLLLALAASVSIGIGAVLWMRTPDYRPLIGVESMYQVNEVVGVLDQHQIDHTIDEQSGLILVGKDDLYEARMKLAGAELMDGGQVGYELLDEDQGFGVSQFMEQARHRRSVEGELARSVATITAVQSARVLLATPKTTTFLRDNREPSASVTVVLMPGRELDAKQIKGITNLVAGAVPELDAAHVAVVDQTGKLLSMQEEDESLLQTERNLAYVKKLEDKLQEKLHNILIPTVGPGRYTAEVTADVDFTWVEQTQELFNPDLPALRSEERLDENRGVGEQAIGIPGALSNQPPAVSAAPEIAGAPGAEAAPGAAPRSVTSQSTRNYELDRTLSHTRHAMGEVMRLTVSIVVDDLEAVDPETQQPVFEPWPEPDLARLTEAIKTAIGYSAARGDRVNVVNSPFYVEPPVPAEAAPWWQQAWLMEIVKQSLGGIVLLILVLGLLRPMFKKLSVAGASELEQQQQQLALANIGTPGDPVFDDELEQFTALTANDNALLLPGDSSYSSKVDTIRGLVSENPGRVAHVLRHWVNDDE